MDNNIKLVILELLAAVGFMFGMKLYVTESSAILNVLGAFMSLTGLHALITIFWKPDSNDANKPK